MKKEVLKISKNLGLIDYSKSINKDKLNILCYHGISKKDEHNWMPSLFLDQENFLKRMLFLKYNYNVITLEEGVSRLESGTLEENSVVITFDDGFDNFYTHAWPILNDLNLPATLYLTSYYALKQTPIFRLALNYMLWQKRGEFVNISNLKNSLGLFLIGKVPEDNDQSFFWPLVEYAESHLDDVKRTALLFEISEQLGLDFEEIRSERLFHLIDKTQLNELIDQGLDVQLHSHRHVTPEDPNALKREIEENRQYINTGEKLTHYCYPSGKYCKEHLSLLKTLGVRSATTCNRGFNSPNDDPMALKRFMDGAQLSLIEFEAELSGFSHTLGKLNKVRKILQMPGLS